MARELSSISRIVINRFLLPGSHVAWKYFEQMKEIPLKYFKKKYSWRDLELLVYDLYADDLRVVCDRSGDRLKIANIGFIRQSEFALRKDHELLLREILIKLTSHDSRFFQQGLEELSLFWNTLVKMECLGMQSCERKGSFHFQLLSEEQQKDIELYQHYNLNQYINYDPNNSDGSSSDDEYLVN